MSWLRSMVKKSCPTQLSSVPKSFSADGVDTQHMLFFIEQHKPLRMLLVICVKFRLLALKFVHLLSNCKCWR